MKIKSTNLGDKYTFKNKFSKNRISKNDLYMNKFLKLKYKVLITLHLRGLAKKSPWFRTMDYHWSKTNKELNEVNKKLLKETIKLSSKDLKLEEIYIYDVLPREYLNEFKIKYLKFKNCFMKKTIFNRRNKEIVDAFEKMSVSRSIDCWYNIDHFAIKDKTSLSQYFEYFGIEAIGFSESYYIIKYSLGVNSEANMHLEKILANNIYKDAVCISCGAWWKKKSFAGCRPYDLSNDAKLSTLEDFLLELKGVFFREIKKKLFSKFYDWKNIPPSVEIYSSQNLSNKSQDLLKFLALYCLRDVEYSEKYNTYFIPTVSHLHPNELNNSRIIADATQFKRDKSGFYDFEHMEELIGRRLAEYFVLSSLESKVTNSIYGTQLKLNKNINSKSKLNKLIKLKLDTERDLYFYKRLYNEICKLDKKFTSDNYILNEYRRFFKNVFQKKDPESIWITFPEHYSAIFFNVRDKLNLIESIYNHFDQNAKTIESKYNFSIIKWTFIVGMLTLITTILFAENFYLLKGLLKFITSLF